MAIDWLTSKSAFQSATTFGLFSFLSVRDELLAGIDTALDTAQAATGTWGQFYALQAITRACDRWLFKSQKRTSNLSDTDEKIRNAVEDLKRTVSLGLGMSHRVQRTVVVGRNTEFDQDPWEFAKSTAIRTLDLMPNAVKSATRDDGIALPKPEGWAPPKIPEHLRENFKTMLEYNGATQLKQEFDRWTRALGDEAQFDLETGFVGGSPCVDLRIVFPHHRIEPTGGRAISASWLPYVSPSLQPTLRQIPRIKINRNSPAHTIMFTGAMNGCSLVITQPADDRNAFLVFHDSVHNPETFAGDVAGRVLLRLDFEGSTYTYSEGSNVNSFNFLYFEHGAWYLVCQPQIIEQFGGGVTQGANSERAVLNPNKAPFRVIIPS